MSLKPLIHFTKFDLALYFGFRRGPNRHVSSAVSSRTADHWQGRCREQLRSWPLHCRQRTYRSCSGQNT